MTAPKPGARSRRTSLWRHLRLFRRDILSSQPAHLYRAWMAEFRAPFLRSFLVNDPKLWRRVLVTEAADFPKSSRVAAGLRPLLGASVFLSTGEDWARQRRIIDPSFAGGRVRDAFPGILSAAEAAAARVTGGENDVEAWASHAAGDVIFRTLFSRPIDDALAARTFHAFRTYQRRQPVLSPAALLPGLPAFVGQRARRAAREIRSAVTDLVAARRAELAEGAAPNDLATRLMTTTDPETGHVFSAEEMVDQVAIFFLAGHETTAATLSWALWLLAAHQADQDRVAAEAFEFMAAPDMAALSKMPWTRDVVRETLRLYPPVPMMVREAANATTFRKRAVPQGSQIVISPWHLHRHERMWDDPDSFDPSRWQTDAARQSANDAYLPFSAGPRICPGAGFAQVELAGMLAGLLSKWRFETAGPLPVPVAHMTVRSRDGIRLTAAPRKSE